MSPAAPVGLLHAAKAGALKKQTAESRIKKIPDTDFRFLTSDF
jgi:hypothetical protein